ncbi:MULTISPECIES: shikimate kinase [unclassified Schaalia]|uniref:shikimate kinase n=1 Tax=unclassified Schaalia TaxID=2691889 RepID=UPI001E423764|nr:MULTISPECIES: shikimate kinase [unclassified Schaalia]MCD4549559.1 hypothetical protein [Schaalia sp. lx-260]MCD4558170.1 hypothetical protein [Schaalia sp. lx-100]
MYEEKAYARLIFVGVPGSGKTAVGEYIAQHTGVTFIDVDTRVGQVLHMPIHDLIITGDERLHEVRQSVALDAISTQGVIVALGASQVHDPAIVESIDRAQRAGTDIVQLSVDISTLTVREGMNVPRPVSLGAPRAMLAQMMSAHQSACERIGAIRVDTNKKSITQVAFDVMNTCKMLDG